ncbi:hypothetical protein [Nostoc sphaeroides]|uniref:Uncharacterized protein n=1 Tax=Nostoc sphaeroides CCNUC1 TaxID=2653204 RepID=A0A5P8WIM4_9NOSO|nr:hypothetical protein [Nostoc sphaeroides]QFS52431.1 hypothetical protein GXM_09925 [Nostoc sphaeroides CCNUC1]
MNPQENAELLAALMRQEELLHLLVAAINKPKLGLHSEAGNCKIYCNRQHGGLWYTLNGEPSDVPQSALTGYLKELRFENTERRKKETCKLLITIQADRTYILESGYDTHFSKSLLTAMPAATRSGNATLRPEQLYAPVTLQPQPGTTDESVLSCRVWVGSELIKASYGEETDWKVTARQALDVVKAASEMVF